MNPLNQALRKTFHFSSNDLLANRQGRLSQRQQARQQATRAGIKLGVASFILVLLGTIGLFVAFSLSSGTTRGFAEQDSLIALAILGAVIGLIIVVGYFSSRKYIAATTSKTIQIAEGEVQHGKMRPDSGHFEIKIGGHKIRLLTPYQLDAFQVGTAYRIHYLKGPVPTILSAEVIGSEAEASLYSEEEESIEQDIILQRLKKGRKIVAVLALLALAVPLVFLLTATLPGLLKAVIWFFLLIVSVLFVFWALR
ncbi:MAG: hypothetical protein N3D16_04905 [Anaerolineales bacterium]|nr:hypothetical protein [Anaerolineales bacterium]